MTARELKSAVEVTPTLPNGSNSAQLQDIKEEEDAERKEDLLLPPLPCTVDQQARVPFDLSKALEIPCSASISNCNNGDMTMSPLVASPRVSLKKKFSNVLLSGDSPPVPFPDDSPMSDHDPVRPIAGFRSQSTSNATSFQHILPTLSMAIEDKADASNSSSNNTVGSEGHIHHFFEGGKPPRKFSISSSSNSSHSNTSITDELFYKIPPPRLSYNSRSRSRSNSNSNLISTSLSLEGGGTTPTTVMNTPNSSTNNIYRDMDLKKKPLLRRASSAIMRKGSKRTAAASHDRHPGGAHSASSTPILQSSAFFDMADSIQRTPPRDRAFRNSTDGTNHRWSSDQSLLAEEDENMNYVTKLGRTTSRNPSIGSRVKRGFSRIISTGGSVRRAVSTTSLRSDQKTAHVAQDAEPMGNRGVGRIVAPRGSLAGVLDASIDTQHSSGNVTPVSTSTMRSPKSGGHHPPLQDQQVSHSSQHKQPQRQEQQQKQQQQQSQHQPPMGLSIVKDGTEWKPNEGSPASSSWTARGRSCSKKGASSLANSNRSDVTVDLDKLTMTVPVITVTDDPNSKNCTPIQMQSNLSLDEVFTRNDAGAKVGRASNTNDNAAKNGKKPEMMSLTDYIRVLVKQQQVEDERMAILEKSFRDSGWCSGYDLKNLRHKRVVISKKWAERISFYQSRLDS
ncbi:uncharacterized protein ZBIST_3795 [Zygosaccharomyces bailii]|nr:uncharacterized protein ZBIST_3795 [Zygosaccharomyces bailii]